MRICFVVHQFLPRFRTGTELYVYRLARAALAKGHEVTVYAFEPHFDRPGPFVTESEDVVDGLRVVRFSASLDLSPNRTLTEFYNPFHAERFGRILEETAFDVVHFFHVRFHGAALIEEAAARGLTVAVHFMDFFYLCPDTRLLKVDDMLCRGPVDVYECIWCERDSHYAGYGPLHEALESGIFPKDEALLGAEIDPGTLNVDTPLAHLRAAAIRPDVLRSILGKADQLFAPSEFLKSLFVRNGYDDASIEVMRYGVDQRLADVARARKPLDAATLRIGYLGSIAKYKGVHLLVGAFLELDWPGATLTIHGDSFVFEEYSGPLARRANRDERIRFAGGFAHDQLAETLATIDILVVPSLWYENTPFVMLEAQAAGIPVLAADLGGMTEVVRDGEDGLLFKRANPRSLKAALTRLRDEPELAETLRKNLSAVKTLPENADELLEHYARLIESHEGSDSRITEASD
ncbi:MAG: glycosyltransferase family 4 protein [Planctomycetota bacterium]